MRGLAILVVATGCRAVLGFEEPEAAGECFHDDFESGSIDPDRWQFMDPVNSSIVDVVDGALVIKPPGNRIVENGIATLEPVDFVDGAIEVEVDTQSSLGSLDTFLLVLTGPDSGYGLIAADGQLVGRSFVDGIDTPDESIPFDPALRFWRAVHDSSDRTIRLEASTDESTFRLVRTLREQAPPLGVSPRLQAGIYNVDTADPGHARFQAIYSSAGDGTCF